MRATCPTYITPFKLNHSKIWGGGSISTNYGDSETVFSTISCHLLFLIFMYTPQAFVVPSTAPFLLLPYVRDSSTYAHTAS